MYKLQSLHKIKVVPGLYLRC